MQKMCSRLINAPLTELQSILALLLIPQAQLFQLQQLDCSVQVPVGLGQRLSYIVYRNLKRTHAIEITCINMQNIPVLFNILYSGSDFSWAVYCEGPHSFIWRGGGRGRGKQNWGTLSRGFGLRSFRPEISAWGVFVGRRFRPEEFLSAGDFDLGSLLSALLSSLLSALCC